MVRLGLAAVFLLTALGFASVPACGGETDSTTFRIQDYIPVKFTDFGWKLDGGARMKRSSDYLQDLDEGSDEESDDRYAGTRVGTLGLGSEWTYRFETKRTLWNLALISELDLEDNTVSKLRETTDFDGGSYSLSESDENDWGRAAVTFDGDARKFVFSDYFVGGDLTWKYLHKEQRSKSEDELARWFHFPSSDTDYGLIDRTVRRSRTITRDFQMSGVLLIGWGRVYEGVHSGTAMFMISELEASRLLRTSLSHSQVWEFADLVHGYRMEHALDGREHRSQALRGAASYLADIGVVQADTSAVLLVLEDVWDYYPIYTRRFGFSFSVGFGGNDHYESKHMGLDRDSLHLEVRRSPDSPGRLDTMRLSKFTWVSSDHDSDFGATDFLLSRCEFYRPLSLHWQLDVEFMFKHFINKPVNLDEDDPTPGSRTTNHNLAIIQGALRFIHDARTDLLLTGELTGDWFEYASYYPRKNSSGELLWDISAYEERNWLLDLGLTVSYRVSVPTVLQVKWSYFKQVSDTWYESAHNNGDSHGFDLSAGITHWLF